ncbi:MAG: chemotaxis protein CheW [Gemmatimonadaceae bacterium]
MTPTSTPSVPNESIPLRFRERVRARLGSADLFVFRVGDERFAFDVRAVEEVLEVPEIYAVPGAAAAVAGVCRHGGGTLSVARASALLGVDTRTASVVLVMRRGADRVGLLVDDVDDVRTVELLALRNPPHETDDLLLAVHWDGETLLSVLDARAVITVAAAVLQRESA